MTGWAQVLLLFGDLRRSFASSWPPDFRWAYWLAVGRIRGLSGPVDGVGGLVVLEYHADLALHSPNGHCAFESSSLFDRGILTVVTQDRADVV